jgi:GNAT superfamily N-acetyltransferase
MSSIRAFEIRRALPADIPSLTALVELSVRTLVARDYDPRQVESSLRHVFGVDSRLVEDGTYFVASPAGTSAPLVGAGGWSRRKTPCGGDQATPVQDSALRGPGRDPAVIRAFFLHPAWERRGIGRLLLERCEDEARHAGFTRFELIATRTGRPLYAACGYRCVEPVPHRSADGIVLDFFRMEKSA